MSNPQTTLLMNKSALLRDINSLKINDSGIKEYQTENTLTRTSKGNHNKKISLLAEEKEKLLKKSLNLNKHLNTKPSQSSKNFLTESKEQEKYSFLRELEMDSLTRSNLQDSKSSLEKSGIVRVYEDLADVKHQLSKQQNENKILKETITQLKSNISSRLQEITLLHNKHKELGDKYYVDSEENKLLKKENFILRENCVRQQFIFKSTISTLVDVIDTLVFKPLVESSAVKLNNNVFDNTTEALKAYKAAMEQSTIIKEIQMVLVNNISFAQNTLNINLEKELEKVEKIFMKDQKRSNKSSCQPLK